MLPPCPASALPPAPTPPPARLPCPASAHAHASAPTQASAPPRPRPASPAHAPPTPTISQVARRTCAAPEAPQREADDARRADRGPGDDEGELVATRHVEQHAWRRRQTNTLRWIHETRALGGTKVLFSMLGHAPHIHLSAGTTKRASLKKLHVLFPHIGVGLKPLN